MKEFFKVKDLEQVFEYITEFPRMATQEVPLSDSFGRILATDIISDIDLPDFPRSVVDGYAVQAASTFGSSEGNPAYLTVKGSVGMGESPNFAIGPGQAARIATGGMLPEGSDCAVMIEHTDTIDESTIEVYRSVAPGQNIVSVGEDLRKDSVVLACGRKIRPQETGLLSALGKQTVTVYQRPLVGIISTGDEIVATEQIPGPGQIRDINSYSIAGMVQKLGAVAVRFGIVRDNYDDLLDTYSRALAQCDMILVSGGSSVGTRDYTVDVISALNDAEILVHGISISPGKPTILAKVQNKALWGLPGHVVSAMVVFSRVVQPFIEHVSGLSSQQVKELKIPALLSRNVSSAQGRVDFVRVRLYQDAGVRWAEPILGKSALINTMIKADGLIEIGINTEGLDKGTEVQVIPL